MRSFANDLDRLRTCLEQLEQQSTKSGTLGPGSNVAVIASLRQALNQAMQQNSMLRARLQKIHLDSDVGDLPLVRSLLKKSLLSLLPIFVSSHARFLLRM